MQDYLIVLGREPELAVAELTAASRRLGLLWQWQLINDHYALVRGNINEKLMSTLAGTVKIAQLEGETKANQAELIEFLASRLETNERCEFGLSWYGSPTPTWFTNLGLKIKSYLKQKGGRVRLVASRPVSILSSVTVKKNKLLPPTGYEFILSPAKPDRLRIARTIWVQDFESWSRRDYGRPGRNARVGMLPPKLARLMVNLSEASIDTTILDPFCGSGTVLQEAALLGYKHLIGADADSRAIERTRLNFEWLKKCYPFITTPTLVTANIQNISLMLKQSQVETVVTEPYLGPPLRGHETVARLRQLQMDLTNFYRTTLQILTHLLKTGGRIVMVWPAWRLGKENLTLSLLDELGKWRLKIIDLLPPQVPAGWHQPRGTLWYFRPQARVIREIVVLEKL